eukprot:GHVH01011076.1.p1 GENE.GHVH01011076.1~~GHVH01011076.1.p1  ORF type:complete len:329 (+),score=52.06 GHVH01011076.1:94-1080(+)
MRDNISQPDPFTDFIRGGCRVEVDDKARGEYREGLAPPRMRSFNDGGAALALVPVEQAERYNRRRFACGVGRAVERSTPVSDFSMSVFERSGRINNRRYQHTNSEFIDNQHFEMSPIQCKSLLTCNNEFRQTFPYVYYGLIKEAIDIKQLAREEMIIPFRQELRVKKELNFNEKAVKNHVSGQLQKALSGRFPCIDLGKRLVDKVVEHLWEEIDEGVREAEKDRTSLQVMSRKDIEQELKINHKFSASMGINAVMSVIEGTIMIVLQRGYLFDLVGPKKIYLDIDLITKCVFLNGGQLAVLDRDSVFQDQVEIGENRNVNKVIVAPRW